MAERGTDHRLIVRTGKTAWQRHRRGMRRVLAPRVVLTLFALLLVAAPAGADFGPPRTVATESPGERFPNVFANIETELDARGRGVVVWKTVDKPAVFAADIAADGTPGKPRRLSPRGGRAYTPRLGVGPDGLAAVLWATGNRASLEGEERPRDRGARPVKLVIRKPGGQWSKPLTVSRGRRTRNFPGDVEVGPTGVIAAAWKAFRRARPHVEIRRLRGSGRTVSFTRLRRGTVKPRLAVSRTYPNAAVAYLQNRARSRRELFVRAAGRTIKLDRDADRGPRTSRPTHLAIAWSHSGKLDAPTQDQMRVARINGRQKPVVDTLDDSEGVITETQIATGGDVIAAAWNRIDEPAGEPTGFRIARAVGTGPFEPPADLTAPGLEAFPVRLAIGGGRTVVVWTSFTESRDAGGPGAVTAAVAEPGAAFGAPAPLTPADEFLRSPSLPQLTMNANGAAIVTFLSTTDADSEIKPANLRVVMLARG